MQTIRSSREIDAIFRSGVKASSPLLMLLITPSPAGYPTGRVCFVAGRRMGSAVRRNRIKRVLREAFRSVEESFAGLDVVVVPRAEVETATQDEIKNALRIALSTARKKVGPR